MKCIDCEYDKNCSVQEIAEDITGCEGHSKPRNTKLTSVTKQILIKRKRGLRYACKNTEQYF